MDHEYPMQASSFLTDGTVSLDDIRVNLELSPDEESQGFDMSPYLNYESKSWMPFEDETTSASSESPGGYKQKILSNLDRRTPNSKAKDPELSRLHRRRAQNRQSQKQFRERKQRAYDEVVTQLHSRDQVIQGLRSEITALSMTVNNLRREKQNCLDAVVRLCQSMYEFQGLVKHGKDD